MRDKTYFNDKIFVFSNTELKSKLAAEGSNRNTALFYIVDEALRMYLESKGHQDLKKPIYPNL